MKTDVKLANALKEMMATTPIEKISVKSLTEQCGINRQTFYYHYRDIYDLLSTMFQNEKIIGIDDKNSWEEALDPIFDYLLSNEKFILNVSNSAGHDLLAEFLNSVFYQVILRQLEILDGNKILEAAEKQFIATFYSAGFSKTIMQWIENDMSEPPLTMIDRLVKFFERAIEKNFNRYVIRQND
ncbi:MAG: TetR/AcrR family transcriptional regulator C-terminal domain-containing protein [Bacilli bacterium]|jgi:probable dihydroxyacetone kinase regulator